MIILLQNELLADLIEARIEQGMLFEQLSDNLEDERGYCETSALLLIRRCVLFSEFVQSSNIGLVELGDAGHGIPILLHAAGNHLPQRGERLFRDASPL